MSKFNKLELSGSLFDDIHKYYCVLIFVLTFLRFSFLSFLGPTSLVIYGIILVYSIIFFLWNLSKKELYTPWIFFVVICFYLYHLLSVCINGGVIRYGSALLQLLFICLISFYNRPVDSYIKDFISISKILIVLSLGMSIGSLLVGLFVYFSPDKINNLPEAVSFYLRNVSGRFPVRLTGLAWQPNSSARLCLMGSIFSIYLITCEDRQSIKWKVLAIINLVFSLFFIAILTNSRTSLIVLLSFAAIYGFIYAFRIKKGNIFVAKIIIFVAIALLAFVILFFIAISLSPEIRDFLINDIFRVSSISTGTGRTTVFKTAFDLLKGKWLFGFDTDELHEKVNVYSTHNLFLEVLAYGGFPSLIMYCVFFFYTFHVAWKNLKSKNIITSNKVFFCFLFCYIISYFICGIAENANVNGAEEMSLIAQIVFCCTHVCNYNMAKEDERNIL